MFWGEDHEGRSPQRIRTGGKYLDIIASFIIPKGGGFENDRCAFASSDPIRLQSLDAFGPVYFVETQKFIGIFRGFEEPLLQSLFDHGRAASLADAVITDHLLTRQRGIVL